MATTRSMKLLFSAGAPPGPRPPSRRSRRSLPPPAPPPRRCGPGIRRPSRSACPCCSSSAARHRLLIIGCSSEVQPTLAGPVGQRGDPPGVPVATAVEDDGGDARGRGTLRDQGAHPAGQGGLVPLGAAQAGVHGRGADQRAADGVVDDLHVDVPRAAVDHQAGALRRTADALAQPGVPAQPRDATRGAHVGADGLVPHVRSSALGVIRLSHYLPVFPTLRFTTSPWYRTPLPLYGSGLRILRILAATSPTCCLSIPATRRRVGVSTVKVMPSGALTGTGWLKPSANSRSEPRAWTR